MTAVGIAQNLRGAEGRCDSVRVFCEAGVDRAFTAIQRISSGWWGRVGVEGKDGGCDGKGALPGREDCGCENDVLWACEVKPGFPQLHYESVAQAI